ncbi:hypothetical protein [Maritimibacter alexandrii]|uniref:hypothetical protein n=1 Tax=Maritimibacter alexandrii TaxID=2570355 RepID=UPI001108F8C5|nr:hypothetical protein [Maritimibacter alexandrii]
MQTPTTLREVIDLWPNRQALVDDLAHLGHARVTLAAVYKWPENGIPAPYHFDVLRAAAARGFALTAEDIVRLHAAPGATTVDLGPQETAA